MIDNVEDKNIIPKRIPLTCGLVMPISKNIDYSEEHWRSVKQIIIEAMQNSKKYTIETKIVSESDESGILQRNIVKGIYDSDIVICDVSSKNANVMFELGLRLAFDKPIIIIKDENTSYTLDTQVIEHLSYPSDLSYFDIKDFKNKLLNKTESTYEAFQKNPENNSYLQSFGDFKVATISNQTVNENDALTNILDYLVSLKAEVNTIKKMNTGNSNLLLKSDAIDLLIPSIEESIWDYCRRAEINIGNVTYDDHLFQYLNERIDLESFFAERNEAKLLTMNVIKILRDRYNPDDLPF